MTSTALASSFHQCFLLESSLYRTAGHKDKETYVSRTPNSILGMRSKLCIGGKGDRWEKEASASLLPPARVETYLTTRAFSRLPLLLVCSILGIQKFILEAQRQLQLRDSHWYLGVKSKRCYQCPSSLQQQRVLGTQSSSLSWALA